MAASPALITLRHATAVAHEALHAHPVLSCLLTSSVTIDDYHRALQVFTSIYREAERSVPPGTAMSSPVLQWLDQDRMDHHVGEPKAMPDASFQLVWDSYPKLLGYLYVKQGSGMGGQLISRSLTKSLGISPATGNHFFHGYGVDTSGHWKTLLQAIDALDKKSHHEMAAASAEMFRWVTFCCNTYLKDMP